jgi:hypothetical protein
MPHLAPKFITLLEAQEWRNALLPSFHPSYYPTISTFPKLVEIPTFGVYITNVGYVNLMIYLIP